MAKFQEDAAAARGRGKAIVLALLGVLVILLVVTAIWWRSLPNDDDVVIEQRAAAPVVFTGAALMAAYESDPTLTGLAESPVLVTAPLATAPNSGTMVLLRTADPLRDITADLVATDAVRLADAVPGTEVTLLCEGITPGMRAPSLDNCRLATPPL